jgi:hypothetical protein
MKRRLVLLGVPLLAAIAAAQAPAIPESAYRKGMPDVLTPAPAPAAAPGPARLVFDRGAFAGAYAKAGRPTIAVLWNRQFTDVLEQSSASQTSIESARAAAGTRESARLPGYAATEVRGAAIATTTITSGEVKGQQAERAGPVERVDLQMRSAFIQAIASSGARLVDRNIVMRTTAAKAKGSRDSQQVETDALVQHAKLIMEVLNTPDPASPTGWATFVSIKRLADGVVLTEGYTDGQAPPPPAAPPRYEADPRGGFREVVVAAPTRTPADVGRQAAEQTLARLTGAF